MTPDFLTSPRRIVVGVSAGIAAYKITYLVRALIKAGHQVKVVPTEASLEFVGKTTWQALSGHPVATSVFDGAAGVEHVEIAREAELIVIAPATADVLARLATGQANDLLTTTVLASSCPVVVVPAMHTAMYENAATQGNLKTLQDRGIIIMEPAVGDLSSGDHGKGRLPEPEEIFTFLHQLGETATPKQDLAGVKVFITAGGTHEAIDPVRFIGNHSTGRFGVEIAKQLQERGAKVTLLSANINENLLPASIEIIATPSANEMYQAVMELAPQYQIGVFAAAVADFRPETQAEMKVKKTGGEEETLTLKLVKNPDILASAVRRFPHLTTIGFAAETGNPTQVASYGREKAIRKQADLLALNQVGQGIGFGNVDTMLSILDKTGETLTSFSGSKPVIAKELSALIAATYQSKNHS
ncbi:bifunctional phosphopantothenoylcysteine decarboxylase/phosphopantothenate--cysteine ligase CoaBC [Gleimia coleocanis]|uniref:bifunctional phosphopantothenoylcysteine decarboxylase/phosphopantothenate--cysteine ligase CoaBC n=1 Tax=Gleimia coleocanis TaxID=103618 RepID=UPI00058CF522|nr:bifunctional phosphopantothenoylcysteine decarboxylase/phosphopantothenate--cysteine ligase CoaBC [Gleimia coleocanis]